MTLKIIENKLTEAGMSLVYGLVVQQALASIALTDKEFREILSLKVLYSLHYELPSPDTKYMLEAVKAHEEYLLYLKRNQPQIVEAVLKILGLTVQQIK